MEETRRASVLPQLGAVGASLVAILLIGGLKSFLAILSGLGFHNWLVLLFRINVGQLGFDALRALNPFDFAALALVGMTFLGLWPVLACGRKIWISIAVALPFIGILLLVVTHLAGRSAVMGAGLVVSFLMLRTPGFKSGAYLGIVANTLLLVGDFGTTGSQMPVVAAAVGVGYVLLIAWFIWIAVSLWRRYGTPNNGIEPTAQAPYHAKSA